MPPMSFREIYANEVLEQRRTRAQRARFWGKVVSLVLMLTIAVTLRTEPQLRRALISAAMAGAMQVTGRSVPAATPDLPERFQDGFQAMSARTPAPAPAPANSTGIRDRIKVNRPGAALAPTPAQIDMQAVAQELQNNLSSHRLNGG